LVMTSDDFWKLLLRCLVLQGSSGQSPLFAAPHCKAAVAWANALTRPCSRRRTRARCRPQVSSHTSIALLAMSRARHKERRILLSECEMFEAERQAAVVLVLARVSRSCSHARDFFVCAGLCRVAHRHHLYCWPRKSVPGGPSLSFGAGSCQARVDSPELAFEGSVQREALMAQRFF